MTYTEVIEKHNLSKKDIDVLRQLAHEVWSNIAYDALEGSTHMTLPKRDVIDLVLDADRLADRVKWSGTDALKAMFATDDYLSITFLLNSLFTDARYGL